ncbi:DUF2062 domain-containing protein [Flammeovirga kamogawensis]|uniref:DUF2062 domain-containing protein n=1 Tax=Flammeovirga kamogawensis TaxID=373891 RepID=A0ABX8GS60_9BACT|nr:DUF2062 domain-containing protein [Flammeovirga kamogawensis]MBB6461353.1 uncharacterized protein (DUF2062 family) [Flammeovirga kamogawensis]QWG06258.1 DUF2062 domain-containing protein [Flammeovirga kamogawensis]TRX68088.1 DUF2062 domain-containing protein [Flammeovirga kamogawensis]
MALLNKIRLSVKHTFTHRVIVPIRNLLREGLTPNKLAWSFAIGLLIGSSPLLGFCTWLCILAAFVFKLNQLAIQVANYVVYPLQIIVIVPYIKLGASWFGNNAEGITMDQLQASIDQGLLSGLKEIGILMLQGGAAWLLVSILIILPLKYVLKIAFTKMLQKMNREKHAVK